MAVNHLSMRSARAAFAADPRLFGRAPSSRLPSTEQPSATVSDDLWLFGTTFAAGFLFVSILIA